MNQVIQDLYPESHSHCFGCGRSNGDGWHLKSYLKGDKTFASFMPEPQYSGGVPGHLYGGAVASLLDCHGTASAAAFNYLQNHETLEQDAKIQRHVTGQLNIKYITPTPMGVELELHGELLSIEGRKVRVKLTLSANETLCAEAEMVAFGVE